MFGVVGIILKELVGGEKTLVKNYVTLSLRHSLTAYASGTFERPCGTGKIH